jgi:hypothetical protein
MTEPFDRQQFLDEQFELQLLIEDFSPEDLKNASS